MNFWVSQIVGLFAFILFVISMQQKNKQKILYFQIISFFLYALQYLLIKAYPGMSVFVINMLRSIIFFYSMSKNKLNKSIMITFIIISVLFGVLTYKSIYDLLPIMASILSVIFTWQPSTKILRIGQISICILWIIYDIFVVAYIGILTETIIIVSTIIALLNNEYNINLFELIFKYYIKIKFKTNDEILNFSPYLPKIKLSILRKKKIS